MSCLSAIYFLDLKGKPIIFRNYRGEVDQDVSEMFQAEVFDKEESYMKPVFTYENTHYCWVRHSNVYIVAVGRRNLNACMIFSYINKLISILCSYFKALDEESIRDNFVIIYELLDETIDHGYPQVTDMSILKEYIKTESNSYKRNAVNTINTENDTNISTVTTGLTPWRKKGIKYSKNEIYMDVVERVFCLVNANCNTVYSEVRGSVKVKCNLSGMPICTLGLNDKAYFEVIGKYNESMSNKTIEMDDIKFHNCVNMNKFDSDREIEFIPPDGDFELMNYRLDVDLKPLFWIEVLIDQKSETRVEYNIKTRTNYKSRSTATNVDISIPVPNDILKVECKPSMGTASWDSGKECILWNIKNYQGQVETYMKCLVSFPSVRIDDPLRHLKKPISVAFDIPYFTVSGIQVRYLKILEESGYNGTPWVRYITSDGEFYIRMI